MTDTDYCRHLIPIDQPHVHVVDAFGSHKVCMLDAFAVLRDAGVEHEVTLVLTAPVTQAVA
jgi:hypothetical protein